jgi:hypoxanthine phosphoribosyltransferase
VTEPRFAHASEAELARILDYYGVRWEYEPRTFPILWNTDGKVVESFSPDFYLPELDIYVELTTLKQSLVRRKNRKLRRLRELYPDIRVKLFYGKDFRALMLKYGRFDLAASLSGLEGQFTPDRPDTADRLALVVTAPAPDAELEGAPQPVPEPDTEPAPHLQPAPATAAAVRSSRRTALRRRLSRGSRRRRGRRAFIAAGDEPDNG